MIPIPVPPKREITLQWPGKTPLTSVSVPEVHQLMHSSEQNRLLWGDNLDMLSWLLHQKTKFKLIYLDPPFASTASYTKTFKIGTQKVSLEQYNDHWNSADYLQFLYVRLQLLYELLDTEGLLVLHIDDNIGHEAKMLLDEIFGRSCFRSELIWELGTGAKSRKMFSIQHNTLYIYSKSNTWTFNAQVPEVRVPFSKTSLKTHFRKKDADGRAYRERVVNGKSYIYYADEGKLIGSVWSDISSMLSNSPIIPESTGYPTQKPEKLLSRIIAACSNPGDLILDPFCGSGTTLVAAQNLKRSFVGIDQNGGAILTTLNRLTADSWSLYRSTELKTDLKAIFEESSDSVFIQKITSPLTKALPEACVTELLHEIWLYKKSSYPENPIRFSSHSLPPTILDKNPAENWLVAIWDQSGAFQLAPLKDLLKHSKDL